ncbi:putative zinc finger C3H1 domain-containing protein isoform X1 [Apostichopus japonicus]|uniref:Putative zinc finger C3H1 domain-containing protein isoform X1 n=1 Tax=Stichopus japonicus TaxID=307972 RepID=A0A2G8K0L8_STIJA|nr:putative zinc finger C3H1 domain-containing protein isoform X1 [Apostichopus japonicus]
MRSKRESSSSLEICLSIEEKLREELSALKVTEVVDFPLLTTIQQLRDEQAAMTKRETQLASKDRINNYGVSKAGKTRANELHRLKKLEEQYALKIKRYKEAQAKASSQPSAASTNGDNRKRNSKETPRPAVSIYQKDKIQFSVNNTPTQTDSETEKENIDRENNGVGRTKRRRSWLDDNSSLTPQLSGKQKRLTQITNFTEKLNYSQDKKSLMEAGKVVDGKKKENVIVDWYSDRPLVGPQRGDYLHPSNYFTAELSLGKNKKHWIPMGRSIGHIGNTGVSPNPNFSNNVDPRRVLCKFELNEQVNKETSGCQSKDKQYFCLNSVTRQLRKDKVEVPILCERQWKPKKEGDKENRTESSHREEEEADDFQVLRSKKVPEAIRIMGVDDSRYYCGREKNIENLESLVLEESHDTELWLKLVSLILQEGSAECQDRALNALSRGLEHNPSSADLWPVYLSLYSSRPEHPDLVEFVHKLCSIPKTTLCTGSHRKKHGQIRYRLQTNVHKVKFCIKCLEVAKTFQSKISSCQDILQLLTSDVSKKKEDRNSHRIFETVLYQTQVLILTGRFEEACRFLQNVLTSSENEGIFLSFLTRPDVSLLWVAYIHLQSFRSLPTCLFEESGSGLGHVRKKTHFICPWHQPFSRSVDDVLTLFETASQSVKDDLFQSCSILYHNWVAVLTSSNRMQEAVDRCRQILEKYPVETSIWKTLLVLEMKRSQDIIKVREIYYEAFIKCPPSPELYYTAAKLENMEGFPAEAVSLLSDCAASFYDLPTEGASGEDTFNLFRILLNQPVPLSFKSPPMQQRLQPILETSQAYIWLCFCFLLTLKSSSPSAVGGEGDLGMEPKDAFELALSSRSTGEGLLDICLEYFQYQLRRPGPKPEERGKTLRQLVKNIITTRPSSFTYPFDEKHFYIDYSFHNTLLDVYLAYLQPKYLTEAYEDYLSMMPKNLGLLQKFLDFLWVDEGYHYIKFLAKSTLATHPKCLFLWNAIARQWNSLGYWRTLRQLNQRQLVKAPRIPMAATFSQTPRRVHQHQMVYLAAAVPVILTVQRLTLGDSLEGIIVHVAGNGNILVMYPRIFAVSISDDVLIHKIVLSVLEVKFEICYSWGMGEVVGRWVRYIN